MAHRNRWFTELKNGWIFHGYVSHNQMVIKGGARNFTSLYAKHTWTCYEHIITHLSMIQWLWKHGYYFCPAGGRTTSSQCAKAAAPGWTLLLCDRLRNMYGISGAFLEWGIPKTMGLGSFGGTTILGNFHVINPLSSRYIIYIYI